MLRKKYVYLISVVLIISFIIVTICSTYALNKLDVKEVRNVRTAQGPRLTIKRNVENEIRHDFLNINKNLLKKEKNDLISETFLKNINVSKKLLKRKDIRKVWEVANKWVTNQQIFSSNDSNLGNVIYSLKTARIIYAHTYPRGTQLKILVILEGGQKAVFKPKWYDKDKIIEGYVYAGNDRYSSEILAFYLSGILNIRLAPITTERTININEEITPFATKTLLKTIFKKENKTCVYGKCFYCTIENPVCESSPGKLQGAIILHVPGELSSYRSPWQRTYKKGKKARWESEDNYCGHVKHNLSQNTLLDLIDVAIFDFLIQNGDRHHYETLNDKVLILDNGKGLGNPYIHHLDILAPLYQCCNLRTSTWERLKKLSGGLLQTTLASIHEIRKVVSNAHLKAIDERLLYIYVTVEKCKKENKLLLY